MLSFQPVTKENVFAFVDYCNTHGAEHDESFLPDLNFAVSPNQPSYILLQGESVVGAVSLLRLPRFLEVGKGRFAILHSKLGSLAAYEALLEAIHPHFEGLHSVYMFLPDTLPTIASILRQLGFEVERYSYVLVHSGDGVPEPDLPAGMVIRAIESADAAALSRFADLINRNFSHLAGHTYASAETMAEMFSDPGYFPGGIALLLDRENAIGTLAVMREYEDPNAAEIMAFSLAPEYRGRGLGRALLRAAVHLGLAQGLQPIFLSVNAENESALQLYLKEGFQPKETMVCYALGLPSS